MSPKKNHQRPFDAELVRELLQERLQKDDPTPQFHNALYGRLMRQRVVRGIAIPTSSWKGGLFGWMSNMAIACIVLVIGSSLTTAYAYVSPNVTRQSSLYRLKLIVEHTELSLSSSPEEQARALLKFSKKRTNELRVLSREGKLDSETLAAIVQYSEQALSLADTANDATTQSEIRKLVAKEAALQRRALQELLTSLGVSELDGTEDVPEDEPKPDEKPVETTELPTRTTAQEFQRTISKVQSVEVKAIEMERLNESENQGSTETETLESLRSSVSRVTVRMTRTIEEPPMCERGERRCGTIHTVEICEEENATAMWKEEKQCQQYETCFKGVCLPPHCATSCDSEGELRCSPEGNSIERCERRGECFQWIKNKLCNESCHLGECVPMATACGNGVVTASEECDDGNTNSGDGCSSACVREKKCTDDDGGNSPLKKATVWSEKTYESDFCEDPNTLVEFTCSSQGIPFANKTPCPGGCRDGACQQYSVCGNRIVENQEQCDDGNKVNLDGCSSTCQTEKVCVDTDAGTNARIRGTASYLGNSGTDYCRDNANLIEYRCSGPTAVTTTLMSCATICRDGACEPLPVNVCGNKIVEAPEECDDGNFVNYDGCTRFCKLESSCTDSDAGNASTINGFVQFGTMKYFDSCISASTVREYVCFNPYQMSSLYVSCLHGCLNNACLSAPASVCGNSIVETGEQCDDGNTVSGDGCSTLCQREQAIDLSVRDISYVRLPLTDTTDKITVSIHVMNVGPAYTSARSITATLIAGATDEYPSGFTWTGEATAVLGINNGVGIRMNGQYVVPRNKPVNVPVTATARFTVATPDPHITNNSLQFTIVSEKSLDPCTDTDGGMIYDQKGTISSYVHGDTVSYGLSDVCLKDNNSNPLVNPKMLSETYCDAAGIGRRQNYECPNGCSNGACTAQ